MPRGRKWDEAEFFNDAKKHLQDYEVVAIRKLYEYVRSNGYEVRWGTGKQTGSFIIGDPRFFSQKQL